MKLKILWFIHIIPKAFYDRNGTITTGTGFWIHSLIDELSKRTDIDLSVAFPYNGKTQHFIHNGVNYYSIPYYYNRYLRFFSPIVFLFHKLSLIFARDLIQELKPDLIHIHGTESIFGLLKVKNLTNLPVIISIQGIMSQCSKYAWGDLCFSDLIPMQGLREFAGGFSLLHLKKHFKRSGDRERYILSSADAFLGRSSWDKSYCWSISPQKKYYHVDEIIRPEFFKTSWDILKCQRFRVFTSGRLSFAKGIHVFLEAMFLLKKEFPNLDVHIAGGTAPTCEYKYLRKLIEKYSLSDTVTFTGWLPASELVEELKKAHVYANSSFIENGCNVQEAMVLITMCCWFCWDVNHLSIERQV